LTRNQLIRKKSKSFAEFTLERKRRAQDDKKIKA